MISNSTPVLLLLYHPGLLQLLRRDPDLLAMVMGHEIAHALARHNTEKMGMGLALSMISSMAMVRGGLAAVLLLLECMCIVHLQKLQQASTTSLTSM
jgi:Zn-dependent protease with chaperone function